MDAKLSHGLNGIEAVLQRFEGEPAIVVAHSGTVNTVDDDASQPIGALRSRYPFRLQVDAASGACAARVSTLGAVR
ncbi:hypothetical protein [Burkholderia lata]|uniref:hypothetical protein n=1 Tax=Burkholderia lata (strain ATCC 17760 / DSM 23089 / LMG 22485 / NCIMB 9086 / R18194 / 383) TaxID=482957 RepID=UPI00003A69F2|nr:hypothetical protein [Burkholderia lata]